MGRKHTRSTLEVVPSLAYAVDSPTGQAFCSRIKAITAAFNLPFREVGA